MLFSHVILLIIACANGRELFEDLRLPEEHIPYFINNNPEYESICHEKKDCHVDSKQKRCWGYEDKCAVERRMLNPSCPGESKGWVRKKTDQLDHFWKQADFGYLKEKISELATYCKPSTPNDSSLVCAKHTRFCRARNLFMDFTTAGMKQSKNRYREDLFQPGQLGGYCEFYKEEFHVEGDHKSPLQSWFGELQHFTSLSKRPLESGMCDIVIEKPAYIMKLDAGVNMYHHFCDFVNLYMSQHINNSFGMDVQLVMWDSSGMKYGDFFHDIWQAFSYHPIIPLQDWDGKKVCFRDAVFPLLPRMRYGHFYNMPLIPGCEGSSMYRAFSQHLVHRLNLTQNGPLENKVRITLLSRGSKYRKILNQDKIVSTLKKISSYEVTVVDFNPKMSFLDQLAITHNSDIFMGMHGAGLTHLLFQPDWGVIFEIYNCDDQNCYKDLARLRGVRYMTWEDETKLFQEDEGHHPTLGAHKKFTNYEFQVTEFLRLVRKAADYVRSHPSYIQKQKEIYDSSREKVEL